MIQTKQWLGVVGLLALVMISAVAWFLSGYEGGSPPVGEADGSKAADSGMARYRSGDLIVGVTMDPKVARVGENRLIIEVRDDQGAPVDATRAGAFAVMPAMGSMPAMRAAADLRKVGPGRYEGILDLSMRGEWPLTVEITTPSGSARLQFDLATGREGLDIASGGTPVGEAAPATADVAVITIDNRRRQLIGVKTEGASLRNLVKTVRAVGEVTFDETRLSEVTLKFDGYIGDLEADYVGVPIAEGQRLFSVYSPELLSAQQEYLEARRRASSPAGADLVRAARERLALWDMSRNEISDLEHRGSPRAFVPIYAPRSGTLIERNIVEGGAARMGQTLLAIADLSVVWVEAQVFEGDLELVRVGMPAAVTLPYLPGRSYSAKVEYVYPYLDERTRTGRLRLSLDNPHGELKPDMYAEVVLDAVLGQRLSVPEEAVIVAGNSRIVFVDLGGGRLKPVYIEVGRRANGFVEVLDGLSPGDVVVTSGNFLVAAETRLKTGLEQW